MVKLCIDVGFVSLNKCGEEICGDHVEVVKQADGSTVAVLADGLGSGVKANILSTLTARIISTMMANALSVEDCVHTITATLPICKVRKVAYSTFTVIRIDDGFEAELIQFDNPHVVLLRKGKNIDYPKTFEIVDGKTIFKTRITLQEEDCFIAFSDGVVHAGVGRTLNFGWCLEDIISFLESVYKPEYTANALAIMLTAKCDALYEGEPGDDTTVCVVKIRRREPVNLIIGPPSNEDDLSKMLALFFSKEGKHIVCGGTTSTLAAAHLGQPLETGFPIYIDPDIPPVAGIGGVDLVTEGAITINRVLDYARDFLDEKLRYNEWSVKKDGASQISRLLFEEATDINFFVGRAVNPAHQLSSLPINFNIKMQLLEELSTCLKQMGKNIKISYF